MADNSNESQNATLDDEKELDSTGWGSAPDQSGWMPTSNSSNNWKDPSDAAQDASGWEMPTSTTEWGGQMSTGDSGWGAEEESAGDGPIIVNGVLVEPKDDTKARKGGGGRGRGRGRGRGGYVPMAPAPRERMDEDALEERMAKIRAQNEKIRERREQIKADEDAFQALMTEERAKQARTRKLQAQIDQTREVNAKRKMDKIGNREWDVAKQDGHWKQKRAWDEGKEEGDQQQKDESSEQPEAAGKGFPLSRLEEKKLEMQKSGITPKSKSRKPKGKVSDADGEEWGTVNDKSTSNENADAGDGEEWGATNVNLSDADAWGSTNTVDEDRGPGEKWNSTEGDQ